MPKRKDKSPEEFYKGQIRELTAENKSLKKQLKQLEKRERLGQDEEIATDTEDTFPEVKYRRRCDSTSCGKGVYDEYEILGKIIGTCNVCGDRKRLK